MSLFWKNILTYSLMGVFVLSYMLIALYDIKYDTGKKGFFTVQDSNMLKGLFCIIVVLVHVPVAYQNKVQDAIGSFAYIGVTFFFMTSAYGLKYGVIHKKNYLDRFWTKRLPPILIPAIICNIIKVAISLIIGEDVSPLNYIAIDDWVKLLVLFYLVFWIFYYTFYKKNIGGCFYLYSDRAVQFSR